MKIEDLLPALRAGRQARRKSWPPGDFVCLPDSPRGLQGIPGTSAMRYHFGASSHSWPSSPSEVYDFMEEDWEVVPAVAFKGYIPSGFQEAVHFVIDQMPDAFDPMASPRGRISPSAAGIGGSSLDEGWEDMARECTDAFMKAARTESADIMNRRERKRQLGLACVSALKALAYVLGEETVNRVMRE